MLRPLKYHRYTVGTRLASLLIIAIGRGNARTVERIALAARKADVANIVGERIHTWALHAHLDAIGAMLAARVRFICLVEVAP